MRNAETKKPVATVHDGNNKEGVALLIVLGVLSLLLVMALSISSSMRADLTVASAHAGAVRVKQLVPMAVDRAMLELDLRPTHSGDSGIKELEGEGGFAAAFRFDGVSSNRISGPAGMPIRVMPPSRVLHSTYNDYESVSNPRFTLDPVNWRQRRQLASEGVRAHFSEEVQSEFVRLQVQSAGPNMNYKWFTLAMGEAGAGGRDPRRGGGAADGVAAGRFTFIAENVSDFLDINGWYPSGVPRGNGTVPFEVGYDADNPEVAKFEEDVPDLDAALQEYVRFDSTAEMRAALDKSKDQYLENLTHYSYFPPGVYHPPKGEIVFRVNIADAIASDNIAGLKEAFIWMGENSSAVGGIPGSVTDEQASLLVENLIDYNDEDLIPHNANFARMSCEPVPMINELILPPKISLKSVVPGASEAVYTFAADYAIEAWCPFISMLSSNFAVSGELNMDVVLTLSNAPPHTVSNIVGTVSFTERPFGVNGSSEAFQMFASSEAGPVEFVISDAPTNRLVSVNAKIRWSDLKVNLGSEGGEPVDQVTSTTWSVPYEATIPAGDVWPITAPKDLNAVKPAELVLEVVDPRDNFLISNPKDLDAAWQVRSTSSARAINQATTEYLNTHPDSDGDTLMYTRNAPMESAGEIGYLPLKPKVSAGDTDFREQWYTVRLLPKGDGVYHRVFDYFTTNNVIERGLINPNTVSSNHLAYAFFEMPVDLAPGFVDPGAKTNGNEILNWDEASLVSSYIAHIPYDEGGAALPFYPYLTAGDVAGNINLRDIMRFDFGCASELGIESVIRNSLGMMSTRNNVIQLAVMVQGRGQAGLVRALATVWRDPYPTGPTHTHRTFVRSIQYINDSP